ncbi:MAG TPA: nucleotide exchange factor GrpE [Planctomycetota bacterium]|nr:nucleotide exchange factor GrpE [Planctomycetota bacterium]
MRRFEEWIDGALAGEDPPEGIDGELLAALADQEPAEDGGPSRPVDSYTLWAAMTALTHEVKLQGRAFKELHTTLGAQAGRPVDDIPAVWRERERDLQREAERRARRQMLAALIDLRDRLERGIESARAVESRLSTEGGQRWLARVFGRRQPDPHAESVAALTRGYELGLARLDQTLDDLDVREIRCKGQPFDPRLMNAIDKEDTSAVADGTVLEVYRSGYEWSGEVFRPAQVKVSCQPASGATHE